MRATQQLKYAIYGIFDLAYHGQKRPVPIQQIGARQEIPARYLEQIFQRLRRGGLVTSKRGPGGGYLLARTADRITLADIANAVEGEVFTVPCRDASERLGFVWEGIRDDLERALVDRSIADLCREAAERGIEREREPGMYHI